MSMFNTLDLTIGSLRTAAVVSRIPIYYVLRKVVSKVGVAAWRTKREIGMLQREFDRPVAGVVRWGQRPQEISQIIPKFPTRIGGDYLQSVDYDFRTIA